MNGVFLRNEMGIVKGKKLTIAKNGVQIINGITFRLKKGRKYCIIGQSGSGKTTLLKAISGLESEMTGTLLFNDEPVYNRHHLIPGHPEIRLITQESEVHAHISIEENLRYALLKVTGAAKERKVNKLLKHFKLDKLRDAKVERLSGGERQRLAIAMALAILPSVLLLDEPFNNLDFELRQDAIAFISEEAKTDDITVVMVSHRPDEVLSFADEILVLKDGKLIQSGTPHAVYFHPKTNYAAGLLGRYNLLKGNFTSSHMVNDKHFVRPSQLKVVKKSGDLQVQITNIVFAGDHYSCTTLSSDGQVVWFHSPTKLKIGSSILLKIENEGS